MTAANEDTAPGVTSGRVALAFCALIILCAFGLGGSPRPEVASLGPLRMGLGLTLGLGLVTVTWEHIKAHRFIIAVGLMCALLPALQLIPLPAGVANSLPGHQKVAEIDQYLRMSAIWRPMSLNPAATWNALLAVLSVSAALIWAIQIPIERQRQILAIILCLGCASILLGLLQTLGPAVGPLYFYETTNNGSAVGLFANRNHQAAFLAMLIPTAFAFAKVQPRRSRERRSRAVRLLSSPTAAALAFAALLVPMIIVTGSRAGLALMLVGLAGVPFILASPGAGEGDGARASPTKIFAATLMVAAGLIALTIWLQRSLAVDRLLAATPADDMRLRILPTMRVMIADFWPLGSGLGSFEKVYQLYEPAGLLRTFYMNHAHNDWLEVIMTGGVPASVLLGIGVAAWLVQFVRVALYRGPDEFQAIRKAGLAVTLLCALASLSDYPLRTPALGILFVFATVWSSLPLRNRKGYRFVQGQPQLRHDFKLTTSQGSQPL